VKITRQREQKIPERTVYELNAIEVDAAARLFLKQLGQPITGTLSAYVSEDENGKVVMRIIDEHSMT
jgi:hypothetical protein